jgi:hypothetical protein
MRYHKIIQGNINGSIILVLFMLMMISCNTGHSGSAAPDAVTEAEVRDFIGRYDKAWGDRDTTAMKEMIDEKYTYFTSTGSISKRENILSWFTPADKYKVDTAFRNEIAVTLNDNVAIVSSRWVGNGTFGTEKFDDDQRCGLVIQKINGKLKIVAEHCVQIAK